MSTNAKILQSKEFNAVQRELLAQWFEELRAELMAEVGDIVVPTVPTPAQIAASVISTDSNNAIVAGTDNLLFVDGS